DLLRLTLVTLIDSLSPVPSEVENGSWLQAAKNCRSTSPLALAKLRSTVRDCPPLTLILYQSSSVTLTTRKPRAPALTTRALAQVSFCSDLSSGPPLRKVLILV